MRRYKSEQTFAVDERRALEQLFAAIGNLAKLEIDQRYVIGKAPRKKPQVPELPVAAKLALWGAAVRLLEENRSFADKAELSLPSRLATTWGEGRR